MFKKTQEPLTFEKAKDKALRILSLRAHSKKELYNKLTIAGADNSIASDVIEFCIEYNFLNDADFAIRHAKYLSESKKYGKNRIRSDLFNKGIDSEYVNIALESIEIEEDEQLYPLMKKKLNGDFDKKSTDRAIRYFASHGYSLSDIYSCINKIKEGD